VKSALDAKAVRVRQDGRVVSMAVVVAVGVREEGHREVLGFDVGAGETCEFWLDFLRSLVRRGLRGVHLVISDAHEGLRRALSEVLSGASWQRGQHGSPPGRSKLARLVRTGVR
jgi:transposase-like protein